MSNLPPKHPLSSIDLRVGVEEIAPDTFWVGKREPGNVLYSNPYLRRFRGVDPRTQRANEFNLLIDPGSSSDFAMVHSKVAAVIGGIDRLSALFINHQDPDVGSSASLISARYAPKAAVVCSEDTWRLIVHTNLPRQRFIATDRFLPGLPLPTGHKVIPVPSPFCHFRGAVMLYDPQTRVLFTGDLFGGLTDASADGLWADESDWPGVRAFHQLYMPTNAALARAVAAIRALQPAVEIIAPQHGRLLRGEVLQTFLKRMERLQVGLDIIDESSDHTTLQAWNAVLDRVLEMARSRLGPEADNKLVECDDLADTLTFEGPRAVIRDLGKWTVERAVERLCEGEPVEIAGPIMIEATSAAAEYDLPTPHLDLEGQLQGGVSLLDG